MEHALPNPPSHPWRTIAVVASGIATLELLALVIVGVALIARPVIHRAKAAATASATARHHAVKAKVLPMLPRGSTSVTVLNGNGRAGAAASEASRVRARGYLVGDVGNAPRTGYGRSVVMQDRLRGNGPGSGSSTGTGTGTGSGSGNPANPPNANTSRKLQAAPPRSYYRKAIDNLGTTSADSLPIPLIVLAALGTLLLLSAGGLAGAKRYRAAKARRPTP